jgi:hypothetical protein
MHRFNFTFLGGPPACGEALFFATIVPLLEKKQFMVWAHTLTCGSTQMIELQYILFFFFFNSVKYQITKNKKKEKFSLGAQ